jgi:hypothetical protein
MTATEMAEETGAPQLKKVLYTANVHTTGGREGGSSHSSDGRLDVKLRFPEARAPVRTRSNCSRRGGRIVLRAR